MEFSLNTTLKEYLNYYWEHTKNSRRTLGILDNDVSDRALWRTLFERNYYQERCKLLEKKVGRRIHKYREHSFTLQKFRELLSDKLKELTS